MSLQVRLRRPASTNSCAAPQEFEMELAQVRLPSSIQDYVPFCPPSEPIFSAQHHLFHLERPMHMGAKKLPQDTLQAASPMGVQRLQGWCQRASVFISPSSHPTLTCKRPSQTRRHACIHAHDYMPAWV